MSLRRIGVTVAIVLASASPVGAQQPSAALPSEVTLPELLRLVAERSPRLAAERVAIDSAQADRTSASVLPNPTVSVGRFKPSSAQNTLFEGSSQQQVTLDFPLLIANQRNARVAAADQAIIATRARVDVAGSDLAVRAAELFIALQAAQEKVAVLEAAFTELKRLAGIVSGRLSNGVASRYELTRVEVELAGLASKLDDARVERNTRSAGLAALIGSSAWRPVATGTTSPAGLPTDAAAWTKELAAGNPQVVAARRDEDAAQLALRRTERERWPVPVVSLGRTWTSEPFGAANFIGLSTEIPLLDKRLGPVAKAEADLRIAQLRREAIEAENQAELLRLLETLSQRKAALENFERNVGMRTGALKEMAEDFYQLGRGSILELIDAARSRLDSGLAVIDMRALTVEQEMRILALTGKLGA
jgi:outer membrane protein, heavy metal efflux system